MGFCESSIDEILLNKSRKLQVDDGTAGSTFSKTTFQSNDANADIDVTDSKFWELILPSLSSTTPSTLLSKLNDRSCFKSPEAKAAWKAEIGEMTNKMIDDKCATNISSRHEDELLALLVQVTHTSVLDDEFRRQAQEWYEDILNPKRKRRAVIQYGQ